jgi:hypothetical protein
MIVAERLCLDGETLPENGLGSIVPSCFDPKYGQIIEGSSKTTIIGARMGLEARNRVLEERLCLSVSPLIPVNAGEMSQR